jgi:hypothetical protein
VELQKAEQAADSYTVMTEWQNAVDRLLQKIRDFLSEYERDGLLKISPDRRMAYEEKLGGYLINTLEISTTNKTILVIPVARFVVGGVDGRVDIHERGRMYGGCMLLWTRANDQWRIASRLSASPIPMATAGTGFPPPGQEVEFTRENFEAAIESILAS